jgi:3-dehydroquinate synthase
MIVKLVLIVFYILVQLSVLMDLDLLATLPKREFISGYAEVAKYGLINNPDFFTWLERNISAIKKRKAQALLYAIAESCKSKRDIVAADERESNVRALLNLGHTFGHALEAETGFSRKMLHGEAVAIGMLQAMQLSVNLRLCPAADLERAKAHLEKAGLPVAPPTLDKHALLNHMRKDKKVKDGKMVFILSRGIGKAFISSDITEQQVLEVL